MSGQVAEGDKVSWNWGSGHPSGTAAEVKPDDITIVSHRGNEITKHGKEDNPAVHVERSGNDVVKLASELTVDKKAEGSTTESNGTNGAKETNGTSDDKEKEKEDEKKEDEPGKKDDATEKHDSKPEPETGDKRKADEKASDDNDTQDAEAEAEAKEDSTKKQKTENGAVAKGSTPAAESKVTAAPTKRKPGRPKGSGSGAANGEKKSVSGAGKEKKEKKEKKEPAVGRAARKTRSQGNVE